MRIGIGDIATPTAGSACTTTGGKNLDGSAIAVGIPGIWSSGACYPAAPTNVPTGATGYFLTGNSFGIPNWIPTLAVALIVVWLVGRR